MNIPSNDIHQVIGMAWDAAKGIAFLHSKNVVHRDVACRNLLLDGDGHVR